MAFRVFRRLRELLDVDTTGATDGDALTYDSGTSKWVPGAGGASAAVDVSVADAGSYFTGTDVEAALQELGADVGSIPFVGTSAPSSPDDGDLWWDTDDATALTAAPTDGSVTAAKLEASSTGNDGKWLRLSSGALVWQGISVTDVTNAVATSDSRLSDTRTPSDGSVTNAKVASGAAIAYSKLSLASSVQVSDLAFDPATQAELDAHTGLQSALAHGGIAPAFTAAGGAETIPVSAIQNFSALGGAGFVWYQRIRLAARAYTTVTIGVSNTPSGCTNSFWALWDTSYNRLAVSSDISSTWNAGSGQRPMTFTLSYTPGAPGDFYIGLLIGSASTLPNLARSWNLAAGIFTPIVAGRSSVGSLTAMPDPLSPASNPSVIQYWIRYE